MSIFVTVLYKSCGVGKIKGVQFQKIIKKVFTINLLRFKQLFIYCLDIDDSLETSYLSRKAKWMSWFDD